MLWVGWLYMYSIFPINRQKEHQIMPIRSEGHTPHLVWRWQEEPVLKKLAKVEKLAMTPVCQVLITHSDFSFKKADNT